MRKWILAAALLLPVAADGQMLVPITPEWFTLSSPGQTSWSGNSLAVNALAELPFGGFSQTNLLPTSALPAGVVGLQFTFKSLLESPRASLSFELYDTQGNLQKYWLLFTYREAANTTNTSWTRRETDYNFPGSSAVYVEVDTYLGVLQPLFFGVDLGSYAKFKIDFRADGYSSLLDSFEAGAVTFDDVQFITNPPPTVVVPEPSIAVLLGIGLIGLALAGRRRAKTTVVLGCADSVA